MIIQIETTKKTLKELLSNSEEYKTRIIKNNDVKHTVLIQNPSETDILVDSSEDSTLTTGIILAAGFQMTLELYKLDDVNFIADADTDLRVMFL
jgi:hypothetical protein